MTRDTDASPNVTRRMTWPGAHAPDYEPLLTREWLVTNGLGGYASGTIAGVCTRRYHGLLVAALPSPHGRFLMLNHLLERLTLPNGDKVWLGGEELAGGRLHIAMAGYLAEFRLEMGLPVWRYRIGDFVVEKSLFMPHLQNTVHVVYRLVEGQGELRLQLRPSVHFRRHDERVNAPLGGPYVLLAQEGRYELSAGAELPRLHMRVFGRHVAVTVEGSRLSEIFYRTEKHRGYEDPGELWAPGYFQIALDHEQDAALVASTEVWETIEALSTVEALAAEHLRRQKLLHSAHADARTGLAGELVLAADQFIISPAARLEDSARAKAAGEEARSVIAGYHWFTDWGRDTMISLEGLTLATGRHLEAKYILHTFAQHVRYGLIPNLFPEGEKEGLYHTADATLWFFHALDRYETVTGDHELVQDLLLKLSEIIEHHQRGTRFGIGMDPADGLLRQGEEGYQLTWMDAKVGDWVVTPRRGKAVEINALWYNALRLLENWLRGRDDRQADSLASLAESVRTSFNRRFWYGDGRYLYDLVDGETGDDPACRPNQVFAISLKHPVLDPVHWPAVLETVERRLLTPFGLRSLAAGHKDYKPQYYGDLRARDAAYHQGTVWAWLIGPFIDAWRKGHPDDPQGAYRFLKGFEDHLGESCIGSISEIFDAQEPFTPRGCIAQAWSVAEVLRCVLNTARQ